MPDLHDYVHREIDRALTRVPGLKAATITGYDPKTYTMKAMLHPDERETAWFPVNTLHVGDNFGVAVGPTLGDQIVVGFIDNNMETPTHIGRLHSDKEKAPEVQSGEVLIKTGTGVTIFIDKDGKLLISSNGTPITIDASGGNIAIKGNVDFSDGYVKHNGHDIGDTHMHTDVLSGADLSGPPL